MKDPDPNGRFNFIDFVRACLRLGMRCPSCKAKPLKPHHKRCSIGYWDGGIWA